jgi:hypothetical protein
LYHVPRSAVAPVPGPGYQLPNAIMTAVDQGGDRVARYRVIGPGFFTHPVEITVHPGRQLTHELISARDCDISPLAQLVLCEASGRRGMTRVNAEDGEH